MNWIEQGSIKYRPAVVNRNNVIHINDDGFVVDRRYYSEESPRRWYFVIDVGSAYIFQVVSMAYRSGWDSWDKSGEALSKYLNGEVEILMQKTMDSFDFSQDNFEWINFD